MEGERPFIDEEWRAVREDHGIIIGLPSMEALSEDLKKEENAILRMHHECKRRGGDGVSRS